ncbi:MFS transporter [Paraburkholderia sp. J7]|uniref:MFS transporter n=1 Tax=Paraburkholderia sp. J7 TaxID=2805438 RepID=UPI002AB61512|nr:MFS transporter [Paraburkholderia sp. J7]
MAQTSGIDVEAFIDQQPISRFQWLVGVLCFWIVVIDGFDTVLIGFVAPDLMRDWGVSKQALGPVLSSALFGLMVGALTSGPAADRWGRKRILLVNVSLIALATLAGAFSNGLESLAATRFVAGIGLGAAIPTAVSLWGEFVPRRLRSALLAVMCSGFPIGAMGSGLVAAWVIPSFGWRAFILCGGAIATVTALCIIFFMPESVKFLAAQGARADEVRRILLRMNSTPLDPDESFWVADVDVAEQGSIRTILSPKMLFGTVVLWICYFTGLFVVYLLLNWLPTMMHVLGYSVRESGVAVALFSWGGAVGSLIIGWIMGRCGAARTLIVVMLLGACLLFSMSITIHSVSILYVTLFVCGLVLPTQNIGMNTYAALYYPTNARATGVSWMHGIGRLGAVASALVGAQLLGLGWSIVEIFAAAGAVPVIGALAMLMLKFRKSGVSADHETVAPHIIH